MENKMRKIIYGMIVLGLLIVLYLTSTYNYLLFHSLAELFSISIAFIVFALAWNASKYMKNNYLLLIGIACLFIGILDILHTLSYKGMMIFTDNKDYATQLWIAARFLESLSILAALLTLRIKRTIAKSKILIFYSLVTTIIICSIFVWGIFPISFIDGVGLTPFKVYSEYAICIILLIALVILYRIRDSFDKTIYWLLISAIIATIISELAFTFYITVYGTSNLIGHYFKLFSFYFLYRAIVIQGIQKPFSLMFRDLNNNIKRIKENEEHLRFASTNANLGFMDYYPEEHKLIGNRIWETQLGYEPLEIRKSDEEWAEITGGLEFLAENIHPKDKENTIMALENYINGTAENYRVEYRMKCKNGKWKWFLDIGNAAERDSSGKMVRLTGTHLDIDEIKEVETALEKAKIEAESATKTKGEFLANMSHEIRTPMNAITGLNNLLVKTKLNAKQKDYVKKMGLASQGLLGIINDILDFSKIESGKLRIENIVFSLDEVIDKVLSISTVAAYSKGIELIIEKDNDVPDGLVGDSLRLSQVLLNLVSNAIKFTDKGEVLVKIKNEKTDNAEVVLKFIVEDTGIGMKKAQTAKLFQAFSQVDASTTRKYGGTGLGLSISKNLIELMGGEIAVESEYGAGSRFYFSIRFKLGKIKESKKSALPSKLKSWRILLVESNDYLREDLYNYLAVLTHEPFFAASGEEAINEIKETKIQYDLILIDWRLPGLNGIETWKEIKGILDIKKRPKIILITTHGKEDIYIEAKNEGFAGFLTKPISKSTLFDAIISAAIDKVDFIETSENNKYYSKGFEMVKGAKILLAEDNEINQLVAKELLESEGFWVDVAENGKIAVEKALSNTYDLVLMDLQMPVLDGFEASKRIRETYNTKELPIIALSADAMSGTKDLALKAGMNDYITKPIENTELINVIITWLYAEIRDKKTVAKEKGDQISKDDMKKTLLRIDVDDGMERVVGNIDLYISILNKFVKSNKNFGEVIKQLIADENIEEVRRSIHTLKGVSGNIGAKKLNGLVTQAEEVFSGGNLRSESFKKKIIEIEFELDKTILQIEDLVKITEQDGKKNHTKKSKINKTNLLIKLEVLKRSIELNYADSKEHYSSITKYFVDHPLEQECKKMGDYINDYDFDSALKVCIKIIESVNE